MRYILISIIVLTLMLSGCRVADSKQVSIEAYATQGDVNAPVTFVEFSDYQCPFCKKFTTESLPLIMENYVETGKVRFVFKDFPLAAHPTAKESAVAARCAGEQGKYVQMHDVLFENQKDHTRDSFMLWAGELDLDLDTYTLCLDDPSQVEKVENDFSQARALGIVGTPSFLINNQIIRGAQPYEAFAQIIEGELNNEIILEASDDAACNSDADCSEPRSFPPFCSASGQACILTITPSCKLPRTTLADCTTLISEQCSPCQNGCEEGVCA